MSWPAFTLNPILQPAFPTHLFINEPVGDDFPLVRRLKLNLNLNILVAVLLRLSIACLGSLTLMQQSELHDSSSHNSSCYVNYLNPHQL